MLLGMLAFVAPAAGAIELEWDAPASCPDRASAQARLERALEDRQATPHEPTRIEVEVREAAEGYALTIKVDQGERVGRRTLEGNDCDALADVAALVVAIALEPGNALDFETLDAPEQAVVPVPDAVTVDEAPQQPAQDPPHDAVVAEAVPRQTEPPAPRRPVFFAQTGVGIGVGMLPSVGPRRRGRRCVLLQ